MGTDLFWEVEGTDLFIREGKNSIDKPENSAGLGFRICVVH